METLEGSDHGKEKGKDPFYRELSDKLGAVLAPVGESWWAYMRSYPNVEMYADDGAHASPHGSEYAAKVIWASIRTDMARKNR